MSSWRPSAACSTWPAWRRARTRSRSRCAPRPPRPPPTDAPPKSASRPAARRRAWRCVAHRAPFVPCIPVPRQQRKGSRRAGGGRRAGRTRHSRPGRAGPRGARAAGARRYLISQHPDVEAKLAAELDGLGLLASAARPRPRPMVFEDLAQLRYLSWVVKARPGLGGCKPSERLRRRAICPCRMPCALCMRFGGLVAPRRACLQRAGACASAVEAMRSGE